MCVVVQGSGVDVFAVQPGLTSTSLYSGMQKTFLFYWFFVTMTFIFGQSPERGSLSLLYCATAPELEGTQVYVYSRYHDSCSLWCFMLQACVFPEAAVPTSFTRACVGTVISVSQLSSGGGVCFACGDSMLKVHLAPQCLLVNTVVLVCLWARASQAR